MNNNQPNAASEQSEMKQSASSNEIPPILSTEKELSDLDLPLDATSGGNEQDGKRLPQGQTSQSDRKDASNFDEAKVNKTSNSMELENFHGQGGDAPSMLKCVDDLKVSEEGKPESVEQSDNSELIDQTQQISELPKVQDSTPTSIAFKEEAEEKDGAASALDANLMAGVITFLNGTW